MRRDTKDMQTKSKKPGKLSYACFCAIRFLVRAFYPKIGIQGLENLPEEPCIIVGNHSQMHGPIAGELYFPGERAIWCAGQMMHLKEVPPYAYADFWCEKPKYIRWFFRLMSYIIAPVSVCVFNNAHTIPVYRDSRIVTTFRRTIADLKEGKNIIIFPECAEKFNAIVNQFQDRFISVAKLYYKRTGKLLSFVPMYLAPRLKTMYLGTPIAFRPEAPDEEERRRICGYIMEEITRIAQSLPEHTVVPYNNISPKLYHKNTAQEVSLSS